MEDVAGSGGDGDAGKGDGDGDGDADGDSDGDGDGDGDGGLFSVWRGEEACGEPHCGGDLPLPRGEKVPRGEEVSRGEVEGRRWAREDDEDENGGGVGGVEEASSEGDMSSGDDCLRLVCLDFLGASTHVSCRSCLKHLNERMNE